MKDEIPAPRETWVDNLTPEEHAELFSGNATTIISPQYRQLQKLKMVLMLFDNDKGIRAAVNNRADNMEIWDLLSECWQGVLDDLRGQGDEY